VGKGWGLHGAAQTIFVRARGTLVTLVNPLLPKASSSSSNCDVSWIFV
jgi:hypothetical protein